jgi:hypothetical protein
MAEIRTVTTLRRKQHQIEVAIADYEKRLTQARADLEHVNATITIFEASGDTNTLASYVDLQRLFKSGELAATCKAALADGPKDTREIAAYIVEVKGLDAGDTVLARAIMRRINYTLRVQARGGTLVVTGRYKDAYIWRLSGNQVVKK